LADLGIEFVIGTEDAERSGLADDDIHEGDDDPEREDRKRDVEG
jgi:hypothetical protein